MKYVTRETGNLFRDSVEPRPDADSDDRPWNRVREAGSRCDGSSTDGVERVASRFRHGRHDQRQAKQRRSSSGSYGRKRPRRDTVTRGDDKTKTSVRPISLRRTVSKVTHVNGSTSARSPTTPVDTQFSSGTHTDGSASVRPSGNSDSHSDSQSDNFVDDYWVTFIHPLSSASRAQLSLHCVSVTHTVSQFINSRTFLRRCLTNSIFCDSLSHHSTQSDSIAPDTRWYTRTCLPGHLAAAQDTNCEPAVSVTENDRSKVTRYTRKRSTERPSGTDCYNQ